MKNVFLFHLKNFFLPQDIQVFVVVFLVYHTFQIQKDKWKWNNLCHELACINLQVLCLEKLKNCFKIVCHQTWSDFFLLVL